MVSKLAADVYIWRPGECICVHIVAWGWSHHIKSAAGSPLAFQDLPQKQPHFDPPQVFTEQHATS